MSEASASYRVALRSSTVIAASSIVAVLFNVVRAKGLAVLLGPSGVGLFAIYTSIILMVGTLAGMGISTSGVRQVAEADAKQDNHRIASTLKALRLSVLMLGVLGSCLLYVFSAPLSRFTFLGSDKYAGAIALLSIGVFFTSVSQGQQALLQGKRLIRQLAASRILSAASGTAVTLLSVWLLGTGGIVVAMVATAIAGVVCTHWFTRRLQAPPVSVTRRDIWAEAGPLLNFGLVFMISGLLLNGSMFLQRAIVIRQLGLDEAGYYQAAYALSVVYVGFILSAMSADFLPRLTSVAHDDGACNQMVNEQAEISLLLAAPGILATYTLAPLVIYLFYSAEFAPAAEVLRWQILGILGQVLTWPMGFIMVAKGRSSIVFFTNFAYAAVHLVLLWLAIRYFGLPGTGMAFALLHVYQWLVLTKVSRDVSGFRWSKENIRIGLLVGGALLVTAVSSGFLNPVAGTMVGAAVTLATSYVSLSKLSTLAGASSIADLCSSVKRKYIGRPRQTGVS